MIDSENTYITLLYTVYEINNLSASSSQLPTLVLAFPFRRVVKGWWAMIISILELLYNLICVKQRNVQT